MDFLLAIGIGINVFTLVHLISSKRIKNRPNHFGLLIILVWTFRFLLFYMKFEDYGYRYPFLLIVDQFLFLLDPVLIWLYAKSLLNPVPFCFKLSLHFLLFFVGVLLSLLNAILYPEEIIETYRKAANAVEEGTIQVTKDAMIYILFLLVYTIIYFIMSLIEIRKYNYSLFQNFSNIDDLKVTWLITFQRLWIVFFLIPIVVYFVNYLNAVFSMEITTVMVGSSVLLSIFFNSNLLNQSYDSNKRPKTYVQSKTPEDVESDDKINELKIRLENDRYYQDEQLTLNQLAGYLQLKPVELTNLIKQTEYENFYDLINTYRIEAVKKELKTTDEQIIVTAYRNGFNSKSTFNKIFKEKTGLTPKEYRHN
jgi:AraC-like DNA-binding protein